MIFQTIFGTIKNPYTGKYTTDYWGFGWFIGNIIKLLFVVGGLLTLFNLIFAGFQFLNAGGDPKAIEQAWNKIWQSLIGILIMVVSFVIMAVVGLIFFGNPTFIFEPIIYGPN